MARKKKILDAADIFDGEMTAPAALQLNDLQIMVNKALELQRQLDQLSAMGDEINKELNTILTKSLPDQRAAAGVPEFKTEEGAKVSIKEFVHGSLPKEPERRKAALKWLVSAKAGGLIKSKITIDLEKGQTKEKKAAAAALKKLGIAFYDEETVHPQSLMAFARERMEAGQAVPLETLGLFAGRAAKITPPKQKAAAAAKPARQKRGKGA